MTTKKPRTVGQIAFDELFRIHQNKDPENKILGVPGDRDYAVIMKSFKTINNPEGGLTYYFLKVYHPIDRFKEWINLKPLDSPVTYTWVGMCQGQNIKDAVQRLRGRHFDWDIREGEY